MDACLKIEQISVLHVLLLHTFVSEVTQKEREKTVPKMHFPKSEKTYVFDMLTTFATGLIILKYSFNAFQREIQML